MKKVLLVTNAEYGQANVFLAVGHALQALDPDVEIHFASFAPISNDVSSASAYSVRTTPGAKPWTFHLLDGPNFMEAFVMRSDVKNPEESLSKHPTFSSTMEVMGLVMPMLLPWDGPQFMQIYKSFARIVDEIKPDVTAVDNLFCPALTACRHLGIRHLVLSPNTLKDFAAPTQPRAAMLWKYPALGSAFPFPVPWHRVPLNIFYCLCLVYHSLTDRNIRAVKAHVKRELGGEVVTTDSLMLNALPSRNTGHLKILVANRPEIEFPLVVPAHVTACGPVIRPVEPVGEVDAELEGWLKRGPTVFISLGTHRAMDEGEALEMAGAVQQLLDAAEKKGGVEGFEERLQVFWKLKRAAPGQTATYDVQPGSKVHAVLAKGLDSDQIRIVDWVKPQPSAVLQAGSVVCSVNHGGANSFHDALVSGVPQVVLPSWLDCYDFASRAEHLGIGRWACRSTMPRCTAREMGPVLVDVVLGPKALSMRAKVQELAALCAKSPGSSVAAAAILEEVDDRKSK